MTGTSIELATKNFVNISGYKFVSLENLDELRLELRQQAYECRLKGTVLLSGEGINVFVAGTRTNIDSFVGHLKQNGEFADLKFKESTSDHQPFNRMLVRIKKEIIAFGVEEVDPETRTSQKLPARQLKEWLQRGDEVTLLDVRNDYEVEVGTFSNAVTLDIGHFREFPKSIEQLSDDLKKKPIVMFCTGGIRCEKAGPFLENAGFQQVFQLDGGILKYFEEVGGDHYDGDCFVFDKRVALDRRLNEAETKQCYACQAVLTKEETASELYQPPSHCPRCYEPPLKKMAATIELRQAAINDVTQILPGSLPYDNVRPIQVSLKHDGLTLIEFLRDVFPQLDKSYWSESLRHGRFKLDGRALQEDDRVQVGQRINHHFPMTVEPDVDADIKIVFEDDFFVVVNKPAPLPVHPGGRFNRNTLQHILGLVYPAHQLRPAHRIDAHTTGLVVLSKTKRVASLFQPQFAARLVEKTYLALVDGVVENDFMELSDEIDENKTTGGGRTIVKDGEDGKVSNTTCRVLGRFENQTTLLQVVPVTGRTHQIRLHLANAGHPIIGDAMYDPKLPDEEVRQLKLHAWKISFTHPMTGQSLKLEANSPLVALAASC